MHKPGYYWYGSNQSSMMQTVTHLQLAWLQAVIHDAISNAFTTGLVASSHI